MRKLVLVTSLAAVLAAPALANAQSACRRSDSGDRVAGTVIGGIAGAIVGSAVAGRKDSTTGALVGGAAGAVVGNQIAKRSGEPCPQGYYEVRDQGYDQRYAPPPPPPPPPPVAYRDRPAVYDYRYSAYDRRAFWAGAPQDFDQRIAFLEDRVARGRSEGSLSRREADQVRARLDDVRRDEYRMRRRGGRLDPRDYAYLDDQLDSISRQIRWERADDRYDRRR